MTAGTARPVRRKLPLTIHRLPWALLLILLLLRASSAATIVYPMVHVETATLSTDDHQTATVTEYDVTELHATPTEDEGVIVDVVVVTSPLPATSTTPPRGLPAIVQDAVVVPQGSPTIGDADSIVIKVVPILSANASVGPGAVGSDTHATFEPDTNMTEPPETESTGLRKQFTNEYMAQYVVKHCGIPHSRMRRIVGGKLTTLERYPWTVGLWTRFGEKPYCGGVIVSWLFVMTAGHCTRNKMAQDLRVSFGVTHVYPERLMRGDQKDHLISVEAIYQNPLFKDIVHGDDISILKMSSPLQEGGYPVTPICIPEATGTPVSTADIVGTNGVVAGWGRTTYGGESSKQLREVTLPIVSNDACAKIFKDVLKIRDEMICAGDIKGTKDACQGDSGGALMWRSKVDDRWYALGVVSFGVKCAEPGYYGTYTRVQSYLDWICKVTDGLLCFGSSSNEAGVRLPSNSTQERGE